MEHYWLNKVDCGGNMIVSQSGGRAVNHSKCINFRAQDALQDIQCYSVIVVWIFTHISLFGLPSIDTQQSRKKEISDSPRVKSKLIWSLSIKNICEVDKNIVV